MHAASWSDGAHEFPLSPRFRNERDPIQMVLSILWVDTSTTFAMLWNLWTPIPQPPLSCICLWILLMPFPLPNQCRHHIKSATPSSSRNSTPPLNWRDRTLRESGGGEGGFAKKYPFCAGSPIGRSFGRSVGRPTLSASREGTRKWWRNVK